MRALCEIINHYLESFKWTNSYGVARLFLGLSTLSILIFNDIKDLVAPMGTLSETHHISDAAKLSVFYIFSENLYTAQFISIIVMLIAISGIYPRYTALFQWWVAFSITTSVQIIEGGDQINEIINLLLVPVSLFDNRKWVWTNGIRMKRTAYNDFLALFVSSIFLIISLQVSFVYFHASVGKYTSEEWLNGTAIYYWCENSLFGLSKPIRMFIFPLLKYPLFVVFATWGTLIIEMLIAGSILIQNRNLRRSILRLGLLFHLMIGIFFGLWTFFLSMIGALVLYLGPKKGFDLSFIKKIIPMNSMFFQKPS